MVLGGMRRHSVYGVWSVACVQTMVQCEGGDERIGGVGRDGSERHKTVCDRDGTEGATRREARRRPCMCVERCEVVVY